jgi:wyosine [tRNA(Phe)-imidazoG37] synthetase (radical SAM superfamily)
MSSTIETRMAQAMQHHRTGNLPDAAALYADILNQDQRQCVARHNLGMVCLTLGDIAGALDLLERSILEDDANTGWLQSLPIIGMTLYQQGLWEDASFWLNRALLAGVKDALIEAAFHRTKPRDYLEPEVFDATLGRALRRYAPRESSTYVYAIDVAGTCNLRCPTCPVGNSTQADRKKGFMEVDLFRQIVAKIRLDDVADTPEVFLFNWGEPLLHPAIGEIIEILHDAGLPSHLSTNLNIENGLREVARANPANLKISLSGFTPESYAQTHVRGNLALVKSNMFRLRHYLDQYRATTRVWVGHHIYRSNQAEIPEVAALCKELGFEHHPIAAFFQPLERLVGLAEGREAPHAILQELVEHPLSYLPRLQATKSTRLDCELRFNQTAINFDGSVALCCSVYEDANMLGAQFLEHGHRELEAMKYAHPTCKTCFGHGLAYVPNDKHRLKAPGA